MSVGKPDIYSDEGPRECCRNCIHGTRSAITRRDPLSGRRAAVQVVECRRTAGRLFVSRPCDHCNYWERRNGH